MKRAVITGPESSGKSSLSKYLSQYYNFPYVAEYAREYLSLHGPMYTAEEVEMMGVKQVANNAEPISTGVICDTDALTYCIWYEVAYGEKSEVLEAALKGSLPHCYLLMSPDLPWEPDPLREHPTQRQELFELYLKRLRKMEVPFAIIEGTETVDRQNLAVKKLTNMGFGPNL